MIKTSLKPKTNTLKLKISEGNPLMRTRNHDLSISNRVVRRTLRLDDYCREAFKFNADLSDQDIRSIRASAQGMTTVQYELFLRDIGIRFK